MEKPNNIVKIPTSIKDFFRYWFMFLEPFHNLTNRELDVITAIVRNRYELSKVVKDNILLDKEMVIKLGYRQVDKAVNYFEPEIYPSNIIEKIEEYARKHRDLKECYFKNYLKDDKIAFALIIKGINPNKIIRELNTMIKPLVKNMDISIVVKNEENEDACIKNLIGK